MIDSINAQVESIRANLVTLKGELASLCKQSRSRAEVDALVRRQVSNWRAQASAAVASDLQRMLTGQPVDLLSVRAPSGVLDLGPWMTAAMGEASMLKWFASLTAHLPEGLDAAARAERIAVIRAELGEMEQDEERLLRQAEELGYPIDRRADADPHIVLGETV